MQSDLFSFLHGLDKPKEIKKRMIEIKQSALNLPTKKQYNERLAQGFQEILRGLKDS